MRRLTKAGLAGALLIAAASSASAIEVWQGHLFITAANNACNAGNWTANNFFTAVYRPAGVSDNGTSTFLALFHRRTAMTYAVNGALSGNGAYNGSRIRSSATPQSWSGNYRKAKVTPPSPGATTKKVVTRVQLFDFGGIPNCRATLQGSLGKRPDL